jgi:hypothetical protein
VRQGGGRREAPRGEEVGKGGPAPTGGRCLGWWAWVGGALACRAGTCLSDPMLQCRAVVPDLILKVLKKGTTFYIRTSPDLKSISNEILEKFLGLEFPRIPSWNFNFE